jgi:hypothetical protein
MKKSATTIDALRLRAMASEKQALVNELDGCDVVAARVERREAAKMETAADAFLALPPEAVEVGNGGELAPIVDDAWDRPDLIDTVTRSPDLVTARASTARLTLAADAEVLDLAVDTAETIQARNSLERMLAHQLAAAHGLAMKLTAKASYFAGHVTSWDPKCRQQMQSIEAARMAGAAARMMDTFQRGLLTLDRLRNGGRQVVTVQHVNVGDGGQAVVAGEVSTGGRWSRKRTVAKGDQQK